MDAKKKAITIWLWSCCLAAAFCGLSACASPIVIKQAAHASVEPGSEEKVWEDGMRAFWEGDYRLASDVFDNLSQTAESGGLRCKSLFAGASARLAAAKTSGEFRNAVAAWEHWSSQPSAGTTGEDPRLLTPFLLGLTTHAFDPAEKGDVPSDQVRKAPKDAAATYRNMLQTKEKEVENLRVKLELREKEVRRLRHQLESLEEIHRKYQEKKQEATAP